MSEGQTTTKQIGSFGALPRELLWSQDGQSLSFLLDDVSTAKAKSWGQISGDGMGTATVRPLPASIDLADWTRADKTNLCFMSGTVTSQGSTPIWLVQYSRKWWEPPIRIAPMGPVPGQLHGMAFAGSSSRLFALSEPQTRSAFVRFDLHGHGYQQILPGASGRYLDYSRDGYGVAYVTFRDDSLWVSKADGSDARQLKLPPETIELPRWSPDGRRIAYMARRPDRPWRIYLANVDNDEIREASEGDDNQGAPTWSADGRFLAYGGVECEHTLTCAIHRIDVATGKVQTLPGSAGLYTARWSPDGRYIAALHMEKHQLMLFDVKAEKWHKLADAIFQNDLSWSADSKYVYANIPGTDARIVRIRVVDGHQETALDLRSQDKFNLTELEDLQFSLAPDDSVILHRRIHSEEIYAYDLSKP
jgi:WD40 repeat protein